MGWTALLDACVLYPWGTADLLLRLSEQYIYRIVWSEDVLKETRRCLVENAGVPPDKADSRIAKMQEAFPEALVTGYAGLISSMTNHGGDRHVLAAAIVGKADVIVTDNVKHFPKDVCGEFDIEIQTADQFLVHSLSLYPDVVFDVYLRHVQTSRPPMSVADALSLAEGRLPVFVDCLKGHPTMRGLLSREE